LSDRLVAVGWGVLALLGAVMLAWTWGTWPNAYVDFGRELYVPWRLAEGEVLYRDIAWFNGPLSAYRGALLFSVFGESLRVLVLANLLDVAVLAFVVHALVLRVGDRLAAVSATGVFLALFAFNRVDAIGNDNYLTPYSHEITHGLVLALLALFAFSALRDRPLLRASVVGGLIGLVALTKPEPFLAAVAALGCAVGLEIYRGRHAAADGPPHLVVAACFGGGLIAPGLVSFALLSLAMPAADALSGTLGAWPAVFQSDVTSQYFYRATLGVVDFRKNGTRLLQWTLAYGAVVLPVTLITLRIRPVPGSLFFTSGNWMTFTGVFFAAAFAVPFLGSLLDATWPEVLRPLPLVIGGLAAGSAIVAMRAKDEAGDPILRTALLVLATVLLAKVALQVRLDQYGFALALPATLLLVTASICWLPRWIGQRGGDMGIARTAFVGVTTGVAIAMLPITAMRIDERPDPLGRGADTFRAESRTAAVLGPLLAALEEKDADDTVAVLPEGVMLNYLARRVNPTGHINFMPPEFLIFGEEQMLAAFHDAPPDWIVITHKDTREYGVGFFGRGYGRKLYAWVQANYEPVESFGDAPLQAGSHFGAELLARRR
jgi:hypothetical protein